MSKGGEAGVILPLAGGEAVARREERQIGILLARDEITITHARVVPGERVAGPHVHHEHTDAFYVLEGELVFEVGREAETITVSAGGLVAVPPLVAHSFRTGGDRPARWLTIHARDGGFAAFMRGTRDGVEVEWDIAPVPADGGLPAGEAVVSPDGSGEHLEPGIRLRCELPDLRVLDWDLRGLHPDPASHDGVDAFLVIDGELEATLAGTRHTVGAGMLVSAPPGRPCTFAPRGGERARLLSIRTPGLRRQGQPVKV